MELESQDILHQIGENALDLLNDIPLYSEKWIPLLQKLSKGVDPTLLAQHLQHGTPSNVMKSLQKVSSLNIDGLESDLFSDEKAVHHISQENLQKKEEAREFLVKNTREDRTSHRLITKDSISTLYGDYEATTPSPVSSGTFNEVYRSLRILRDHHCTHNIYTCPYCDDYLPAAELLLGQLEANSEDHLTCKTIVEKLKKHQEDWKTQSQSFYKLWNDPPDDYLILVEDAGKRHVMDGKGVVMVMALRFKDGGQCREHHYFFCLEGSNVSVNKASIAQCWLSLRSVEGAIPLTTRVINHWHDGGTNEYNNSSVLMLYSTLQRMWNIKFESNSFVAYHGKGFWDGLIGDAARIMTARASLIEICPDLHYDQDFYYRSVATIGGKADVSKTFKIQVQY